MPPHDGNIDPATPTPTIAFIPSSGVQMPLFVQNPFAQAAVQSFQSQPTYVLQMSQAIPMSRMPYHPQMPSIAPLVLQQQPATITVGKRLDEQQLVNRLVEAEKSGTNYVQALETLDGVNGYIAQTWKDYYIMNQKRLNDLVAAELSQSRGRPATRSNMAESGRSRRSVISISSESSSEEGNMMPVAERKIPRSATLHKRQDKVRDVQDPHKFSRAHKSTNQATKKGSRPERSGQSSGRNIGKRPRRAPPTREPTPPTRVERVHTGNRFTDEDKEYFVQFVLWKMETKPHTSREEICGLLSEKAPHHSKASWQTYWKKQEELLQDIFGGAGSSTRIDGNEPAHRDINLPGSKSVPAMGLRASVGGGVSRKLLEKHASGMERVGSSGSHISDVELQVLAKCEVLFPAWASLPSGERWAAFQIEYPERSAKSWSEAHRRYISDIRRYVHLFRKATLRPKNSSEAVDTGNAASSMQKRKAKSSMTLIEGDCLGKRPRVAEELSEGSGPNDD